MDNIIHQNRESCEKGGGRTRGSGADVGVGPTRLIVLVLDFQKRFVRVGLTRVTMRKLFLALPLLTSSLLTPSMWAQFFQSSSQQSYALNIPDTSIASPPCQDAKVRSKKAKKTRSDASSCTVAAELKKAVEAQPKAETEQPEKQKSGTP